MCIEEYIIINTESEHVGYYYNIIGAFNNLSNMFVQNVLVTYGFKLIIYVTAKCDAHNDKNFYHDL